MSLKKTTPFFYKHSLGINFVLTEMYFSTHNFSLKKIDVVGKLKFYIFLEHITVSKVLSNKD